MLTIRITGMAGEGKTTLALIVKEALESKGIRVNLTDMDLSDDATLERAKSMQPLREQALARKGTPVEIIAAQAARPPRGVQVKESKDGIE